MAFDQSVFISSTPTGPAGDPSWVPSGAIKAKRPGKEGPLGLGVAKTNLAPVPKVMGFSLVSRGDVGCIKWEAQPREGVTADDLVPSPPKSDEDRSAAGHAQEFLKKELEAGQNGAPNLAHGEVYAMELQKRAKQAGLSWRTVQRAASSLGVRREKEGFQGPWKWSLSISQEAGALGTQNASEASNGAGSAKDTTLGTFGNEDTKDATKHAKPDAFVNGAEFSTDSGGLDAKDASDHITPGVDEVAAAERLGMMEDGGGA